MELISKQDTTNWETNHICSNCDSVLKINTKDLIYKQYWGGHDGDTVCHSFYVQCLVCKILSYVNNVPKLIQHEFKNAHQVAVEKKTFFQKLFG
jgi:hypothetical protein